mmetsp:Transcript_283/g.621  ORF Transcript_283/g.621 Transcript_283/m.621 type:complete len:397 (+) Transcript_283:1431-2621(+)
MHNGIAIPHPSQKEGNGQIPRSNLRPRFRFSVIWNASKIAALVLVHDAVRNKVRSILRWRLDETTMRALGLCHGRCLRSSVDHPVPIRQKAGPIHAERKRQRKADHDQEDLDARGEAVGRILHDLHLDQNVARSNEREDDPEDGNKRNELVLRVPIFRCRQQIDLHIDLGLSGQWLVGQDQNRHLFSGVTLVHSDSLSHHRAVVLVGVGVDGVTVIVEPSAHPRSSVKVNVTHDFFAFAEVPANQVPSLWDEVHHVHRERRPAHEDRQEDRQHVLQADEFAGFRGSKLPLVLGVALLQVVDGFGRTLVRIEQKVDEQCQQRQRREGKLDEGSPIHLEDRFLVLVDRHCRCCLLCGQRLAAIGISETTATVRRKMMMTTITLMVLHERNCRQQPQRW